MTEWYIPVTLLPGVGLLIMSTTNLLNAISTELSTLIREGHPNMDNIIERKIAQVRLLNLALSSLYISSASYVLAGLIGALLSSNPSIFEQVQFALLLVGTLAVLIGLVLLTLFSYHSVSIKREQFKRRWMDTNKKASNTLRRQDPKRLRPPG